MPLESFRDRSDIPKRSPLSSTAAPGERSFIVESSSETEQSMESVLAAISKIKAEINALNMIGDPEQKMDTAADLRSELIIIEKKFKAEYSRLFGNGQDFRTDIHDVDFDKLKNLILSKVKPN